MARVLKICPSCKWRGRVPLHITICPKCEKNLETITKASKKGREAGPGSRMM